MKKWVSFLVFTLVMSAALLPGGSAWAQKGPGGLGNPGGEMMRLMQHYQDQLKELALPHGSTSRVYVAMPTGEGPHPAILILHGTEGFTPLQPELADAFARAGFVAVAACWFSGKHVPFNSPPNLPCPDGPRFHGANFETAKVGAALLEFTRQLAGVDPQRVGLWGQSRGGTVVLLLTALGEKVRGVVAAAPIYSYPKRGGVFPDEFPVKHLERIQVPVLMLQGTDDQIIPIDEAREFEGKAKTAGLAIEATYYEGMGHGGFYMGSHRDATRQRAIEFFTKTLQK